MSVAYSRAVPVEDRRPPRPRKKKTSDFAPSVPINILPVESKREGDGGDYTLTFSEKHSKKRKWTEYEIRLLQKDTIVRVLDESESDTIWTATYKRKQYSVPPQQFYARYTITDKAKASVRDVVKLEREEALTKIKNKYIKYFVGHFTKDRVKVDEVGDGARLRIRLPSVQQTPVTVTGENNIITNTVVYNADTSVELIDNSAYITAANDMTAISDAYTQAAMGIAQEHIGQPANAVTAQSILDQMHRARAYLQRTSTSGTTSSITGDDLWYATDTHSNYITIDGSTATNIAWTGDQIRVTYNNVATWPSTGYSYGYDIAKPDPTYAIKQAIKKNLNPFNVLKRRQAPVKADSPQELKAQDTLRDMLSEAAWRRYITNGFIMVRGPKSGHWYQVFRDHYSNRIRVYENGKHLKNICVHTDRSCPPTDHVINMKVMIECDEDSFMKAGNVYNIGAPGMVGNYTQDQMQRAMRNHIEGVLGPQNWDDKKKPTTGDTLVDIFNKQKSKREEIASYKPDQIIAIA